MIKRSNKKIKILYKNYRDKEEVYLDYYYGMKVFEKLCESYKIDLKPFKTHIDNLKFNLKFNFLNLFLFKIFDFLIFKMKIYRQPMEVFKRKANWLLRNEMELSNEEYEKFEPKSMKS